MKIVAVRKSGSSECRFESDRAHHQLLDRFMISEEDKSDILDKARIILKMYDVEAVIEDRSDQINQRWGWDIEDNYVLIKNPKYNKPYVLLHGRVRFVGQFYKKSYFNQQYYSSPENLLEGVNRLVLKKSAEN